MKIEFLQIRVANHRLTIRTESGLLSCIVLLKCILPYMSDSTLMAHLTVNINKLENKIQNFFDQDPIKNRIIHPCLTLLSSNSVHFPSFERARSVCAYRGKLQFLHTQSFLTSFMKITKFYSLLFLKFNKPVEMNFSCILTREGLLLSPRF